MLSEPPQRWSPALVCSLELIVATATLVFDHAKVRSRFVGAEPSDQQWLSKNNIESFKPIYLAAVSLAQHCYSSDLRSLIPTPEPTYPIVSKNGELHVCSFTHYMSNRWCNSIAHASECIQVPVEVDKYVYGYGCRVSW